MVELGSERDAVMTDLESIRLIVMEYLEGMIFGEDERLRGSMHHQCMQAGHYKEKYEFMPRDEFIEAIKPEKREQQGSSIKFDIPFIDITGDVAIVKVTDECFGTTWTDYLTLIRHDGKWQIVMKAFYDHANDRV